MPSSPPPKLLIVDDEAAQMKALCDTLEDKGYATTGFTSAKEALARLGGQEFDLLITDLMMPEMDGITLLRSAQAIDPHLAGILMTGHGTVDSAVEAMKAGALDYILKPFKLSVVMPVIARALDLRRLRVENERLEKRVREHAAELEVANRELESFSYSVSHDLRAPLRAVKLYGALLQQDYGAKLPTEAQDLLERALTSANRMSQLIEDLLRFSRFSRQPLRKKPVKLAWLVGDVLAELREAQPERAVEIRLGDLPDCVGDESLLRQVWFNLLANAFKFTRQAGNPVIEAGCQQKENERVYYVRDNGAGFDMKYADRLFGVFQRLHDADEFEGTGVGLSIVHRIIQRHGGRIWAEAEENKGAAFYFTLGDGRME